MRKLTICTVGDLGRVVTGRTPEGSDLGAWGEKYPFITPSDLSYDTRHVGTKRFLSENGGRSLASLVVPPGAVCVTCIGATIGKICVTSAQSVTNQQINSIVVEKSDHDPSFVFYLLRTKVADLCARAGGAATPILNKSAFSSIPLTIPPLATQRRIAGILSAYDDLIENNSKRIAILEQMARALYREWFVHFRFPGHQQVKLIDSPLGPIPEGWTVQMIGDVCESVKYGYTASANHDNIGPKFLRITDIVPNVINWCRVPHCVIEKKREDKYVLREGDIVVARTGATVGYAKRINKIHPNAVFASYLVRFRPRTRRTGHWLGVLMESDSFKAFVQQNKTGSAQPQANAKLLASLQTVCPTVEIESAFSRNVEPTFDLAEVLQRKNEVLRKTRDLLLPRLISGDIDVDALDLDHLDHAPEPTP